MSRPPQSLARRVYKTLALILMSAAAFASFAEKLYLDYGGAEGLMEVDTVTGDRRFFVVENYPHIIATWMPMPVAHNEILFLGFTATQRAGIHRLNTVTGAVSPVSGYTDDNIFDPLGGGPDIDRLLVASIVPGAGKLFVLHAAHGPMEIDLATGDRRVISQSAEPPTGEGYPLLNPLDMIEGGNGSLIVAEQFQGLVRIDLATGNRWLMAPGTAFIEPPHRLEPLRDGRLAHCQILGGSDTVFAYGLERGIDDVVSSSGGYLRGEGEPFGSIFDITVDGHGMLYAIDIGAEAIFEINPKSGDRTIISGGPGSIGDGPELPDSFARPRIAAQRSANSADPAWLVSSSQYDGIAQK